jgi:hypothetical protein
VEQLICSVEDCGSPAKSRGLCGRHYAQDQRAKYGICSVAECENRATNRRGWCAKHYARMLIHGTTDEPVCRKQALICSVDDCERPTRARGWCATHWKRWRAYGSPDRRPAPDDFTCAGCGKVTPRANYDSSRARGCARDARQEYNARRLSRANDVVRTVADLRESQGGRCLICGTAEGDAPRGRLHVDHDHKTGALRALLCGNCNLGLGHFKDDPVRIRSAIDYLRRFQA